MICSVKLVFYSGKGQIKEVGTKETNGSSEFRTVGMRQVIIMGPECQVMGG